MGERGGPPAPAWGEGRAPPTHRHLPPQGPPALASCSSQTQPVPAHLSPQSWKAQARGPGPSGLGTIYGRCDLYLIVQISTLHSSVALRVCLITAGPGFPHLQNGLITVVCRGCGSLLRSPSPASAPSASTASAVVTAVPPASSEPLADGSSIPETAQRLTPSVTLPPFVRGLGN